MNHTGGLRYNNVKTSDFVLRAHLSDKYSVYICTFNATQSIYFICVFPL